MTANNLHTTSPQNSSPEFSPSILHSKKGPLNPNQNARNETVLMPKRLDLILKDKRVLALICLFLPPLAVFLKTGISRKFGLSLLLFAFFIFPGILYGFYVTFVESSLEPSQAQTYHV